MNIVTLRGRDRTADYGVLKPFATGASHQGKPVSVVIPCFNEEQGIGQLPAVLRDLEALSPQYHWKFIVVDDASTDATPELAQKLFGDWPNCSILRHHRNLGITGAILSGTTHADTEIVCSIDSDCTYDPRDLGQMVPLIEAGNDMITASPYHPDGGVAGVPAWRLVLSRAASMLYRAAFRAHVYTFTACFRAYRRDAVLRLEIENNSFGGLAEMLIRLLIDGGRIGELPTTLRVRRFGQSKMKVLRTIGAHLSLLRQLMPVSWASRQPRAVPVPATTAAPNIAIATQADRKAA